MITLEHIDDIVVHGGIVVTSDGAKIGSVEQVFLSEGTGNPAFVTVRTGLFGLSESFVPLAGASIDGPRILVAFDREQIRNGPRIESDRGSISAAEESELYRYYGVPDVDAAGLDVSDVDVPTVDVATVDSAVVDETDAGPTSPTSPTPPHPPTPPHRDGPHPPPHLLKHVVLKHVVLKHVVDGRRLPPPPPPANPHPRPHPPPPAP